MAKYGFASKKSIVDKVKKHYPDNYKSILDEAHQNRKSYEIDISKIDCEFTAYFIGLMMSDGYICDDNRFGIQMTDEDCIKFISDSTGKSYQAYPGMQAHYLTRYRIIFSDNKQVENLKRYGVIKCKSKTIPAPILLQEEEKYIPYIIRGLIDGDGCIYYTSYHKPAFYIYSGSYDFAVWMKDVLENKLYMKDIHLVPTKDGGYKVETAIQSNMLKLLALVYDKPYGMSRKYELLRKMFRDYNESCPA